MVGIRRLAGRDTDDLDIERVAFGEIHGLGLAAEFFGNLLARAGEFSLRGRPGDFSDFVRVDFEHKARVETEAGDGQGRFYRQPDGTNC
jgi:hypothetical protein